MQIGNVTFFMFDKHLGKEGMTQNDDDDIHLSNNNTNNLENLDQINLTSMHKWKYRNFVSRQMNLIPNQNFCLLSWIFLIWDRL